MKKITKEDLREIWKMRHLSVKDFLKALSNYPSLRFLLTAAGCWWLTQCIISFTILFNIIYYVIRVFHMVLA